MNATIILILLGSLAGVVRALEFRPPAIPLFTTDPFTQTWIRGDTTTSAEVTHWDGREKQMVGFVRVDGVMYQYLGKCPSPTWADVICVSQTSVQVFPTRTVFELDIGGVMVMNLTFLSSMFTADFTRLSRPVYYVIVNVASLRGSTHDVQLYFDATAQHVVNECSEQQVSWTSWSEGDMYGVRLGNHEQRVLGSKGDGVNIDWGYLYLAARVVDPKPWAGSAAASREAFLSTGALPVAVDGGQPRNCSDDLPALASAVNMGTVATAGAQHLFILAYDDVLSIDYFGEKYRGYWTQKYSNITHALREATKECDKILSGSQTQDDVLLRRLRRYGEKYAALGALAYRQTLAATKLVWNFKRLEAWNFLKEISTDGMMQTMDVIYPASPMFLYIEPELLKLLLLPVLAYANNETSVKFGNPYSPHQLGTYPIGDCPTEEQEPMPLENSGNMFFMMLGVLQRQTKHDKPLDASWFYPQYWPMLIRWADELVATTEYPAEQLCTDDFTGRLANNTNLALKGILALEAFAKICKLVGASSRGYDCAHYSAKASRYAKTWQTLAFAPDPMPHYKMSYNSVANISDSWSIKYNLLWQRILGLDGPFSWDKVAKVELAYYKTKANRFGVPMDPRHAYVKTDWLSWIAAMSTTQSEFEEFFDPIFMSVNSTQDREPFTDLYDTITARQSIPGHFIARPVIGGLFAKMLIEDNIEKHRSSSRTFLKIFE